MTAWNTLATWARRIPVSLRLLAPPALIALALLLGPDLVSWRPEPEPVPADATPVPQLDEAAPAAPPSADWREYAALEPPGGGSDESLADAAAAPTLECIIEPNQVVALGSPVTARIESILVERSDLVQAGQPVVELEASVEVAAVEVARARARMEGDLLAREAASELGELKQERAQRLFDQKVLSLDRRQEVETQAELARRELQRARENRQLAALQLQQAREVLERRTIRSPISGVVLERLLMPGEVVEEQAILRLAEIHPLRVEVILPSAMFGSVRVGMRAEVTPEVPGDAVHVATVTVVDRVIDPASGTFGVRLELRNPDHAIPSGLHCRVRFLDD